MKYLSVKVCDQLAFLIQMVRIAIKNCRDLSVNCSLFLSLKKPKSLFLLVLAQCESVRSGQLRLATVEFDEFFFKLLARVFQLALLFSMVFLQLLELGMEL